MKILIWDKGIPLKNAGGPAGYLWNIKQYVDSVKDNEVVFYSDLIGTGKQGKSAITSLLLGVCHVLKLEHLAHLIINYNYKGALSREENDMLQGVDYVHFHTLSAACGYQKIMRDAGIKTILTIHSPEPLIDELNGRDNTIMSDSKREHYIKRETAIMSKVDYLMFPVPGAIECYTSASPIYENFFADNDVQKRIFFVPTALPDKAKPGIEGYLAKSNLPSDAKRVCYVGRHNTIKGYTYLKDVANKVWEKDPNVFFIIGGKMEKEGPNPDSRWIELGWVNTISLLQEVDVFVLPNQQTYFDIIALEILRDGTPLVTTLTGGNKYLSEVNNGGIIFIPKDNASEAADIIVDLLSKNKVDNKTREIYLEHFTMPKYIERYKTEVSKLK